MDRRILYITGTRADFGLMRRTLQAIHDAAGLVLTILPTGMHLSRDHGSTIDEVMESGLDVLPPVQVELTPTTGATMARGLGTQVASFTEILTREQPDLLLLLGDRGEMLAGAIAALHLNIPVAHIHGGERSGTVDEPVRHAISKLSHIHITSTEAARERLIKMGENPAHVHVSGAPGLDGIASRRAPSRAELAKRYGLSPARPIALFVYHPVLQQMGAAAAEAVATLQSVLECGAQAIALMPNADAGSEAVRHELLALEGDPRLALVTHLAREAFLDAMAAADLMIGNSSAGIIEAASFGTPVVNVGVRQNLRERNANVIDVDGVRDAIEPAVRHALQIGRFPSVNLYGDGNAAGRIVEILREARLGPDLMMKVNCY